MFHLIDLESWPRREQYRFYTEQWQGVYFSVTRKLAAAATVQYLKDRGVKLVPALIWLTCRAANRQQELRMGLWDGKPGFWDEIHPLIPVLNRDGGFTFHTVPYVEDFGAFYESYLAEQRRTGDMSGHVLSETPPENCFTVSVMPYLDFDSFSFSIHAKKFFPPSVEIGRYSEDAEKLLPVSITVNHAVADAWHLAVFFNDFEAALGRPEEWCLL